MDFLKIFQIIASALSAATVGILHATGADKHKTTAGQIAGVLSIASQVAQATHDALSAAGSPSPPQTATAPTATSTP